MCWCAEQVAIPRKCEGTRLEVEENAVIIYFNIIEFILSFTDCSRALPSE